VVTALDALVPEAAISLGMQDLDGDIDGDYKNMIETLQVSGALRSTVDFDSTEDHRLRAVWAAAWLREYRCNTRYLSLLALDATDELEMRFAWLDWWDAACVCREALRRLEEYEDEAQRPDRGSRTFRAAVMKYRIR
jgi:hypothetical protein